MEACNREPVDIVDGIDLYVMVPVTLLVPSKNVNVPVGTAPASEPNNWAIRVTC